MAKTTESSSKYNHLEQMSTLDLLTNINHEDATVPLAVAKAIPQIERSVNAIVGCIQQGGRLFLHWGRHKWQIGYCRCLRMSAYLWCATWIDKRNYSRW